MDPEFERRWRQARSLENAGEVRKARDIYEQLIAEDADRLYVRLRLVAIGQGMGQYRAARDHAVRCAEDVRNARWKDLPAVTLCLLGFDEWALVGDLIRGADWSHPDFIRNAPTLSQHLWLTGDVENALRLADAALPLAPDHEPLRYSRASALRYLGRMDEATAEYEACLRLRPDDPHVHWSLAGHEKSGIPGARIPRIERAFGSSKLREADRPYLHYALYKECEDAGDHGRAWSELMSGAAIKRRHVRYDPEVEAAGFHALQAATDEVLQHRPGAEEPPALHRPIFIVGMPRSGTTLLERILGSHSQVTAGGELSDFRSALSWESDQFFGHFPTPRTVERMRGVDHAAIGSRYLESTRTWTRGNRFLIDKNPENFVHAGYIARALPTARILCLRRNPMDACFSNLRNLFSNEAYGYSYALAELADYHHRFDALSSHWRRTLGDQYMEVRYEALVGDAPAVVRRVLEFCGLSIEHGIVDITRNASPVTTASSSQVREPIHARGIGAWRRYEEFLQPLRARLEAGGCTVD